MKVVGIGAPRTLELRLKSCELGIWRLVLFEAHAKELQLDGHTESGSAGSTMRIGQLTRSLREAHAQWPPDQPVHVVGATSQLAPLVRSAATIAVDRYAATATAFAAESETVSPDQLRAALDTAAAWTATLLALHRVEPADTDELR